MSAGEGGGAGRELVGVGAEDGGQRVEQSTREAAFVELVALDLLEVGGRALLVVEVEQLSQAAATSRIARPARSRSVGSRSESGARNAAAASRAATQRGLAGDRLPGRLVVGGGRGELEPGLKLRGQLVAILRSGTLEVARRRVDGRRSSRR